MLFILAIFGCRIRLIRGYPFSTKEERLTTNRVSGVMIGWMGVAVLIGMESLRGFGIEVMGQIAVLGATLSYALAAIYGRRFKGSGVLI